MTTLRDEALAEIRKLPAAERAALDDPLRQEQVAQIEAALRAIGGGAMEFVSEEVATVRGRCGL